MRNLCVLRPTNIRTHKTPRMVLVLLLIGLLFLAQSCNVTRTVTTQSEVYQRGDTSVVIQTRTVESYDAKKNLNF